MSRAPKDVLIDYNKYAQLYHKTYSFLKAMRLALPVIDYVRQKGFDKARTELADMEELARELGMLSGHKNVVAGKLSVDRMKIESAKRHDEEEYKEEVMRFQTYIMEGRLRCHKHQGKSGHRQLEALVSQAERRLEEFTGPDSEEFYLLSG